MISRRALLGTGGTIACGAALLVIAERTHRLDDVARGVGVRPKAEPAASDDRIVARTASELAALAALVEATAARHDSAGLAPLVAIAGQQLAAVGGTPATGAGRPVPDRAGPARDALVAAYETMQQSCVRSAEAAQSPELARVLASMSAGLAQCARTVGGLR